MHSLVNSKHIILYADDDEEDVEIMRQGFAAYSAVELKTFPNGYKLLSYVMQSMPDKMAPCLIILDIYMPLMNGWETLQRLHKIDFIKSTPVLLLTSSHMECDRLGIQNYNAHFVVKPCSLQEWSSIVDKIIAWCPPEIQQQRRIKS